MYGKEGNRVDHKPLGCPSIILNNPPGQSDCHGCPFRHAEVKVLEQRLLSLKINKDSVEKVFAFARFYWLFRLFKWHQKSTDLTWLALEFLNTLTT